RHRRDAEARLAGEAVVSASDSDDNRRASRRHRPSHGFNPNDASDLKQLKDQLAAMDVTEREPGRGGDPPVVEEKRRTRSPSPGRGGRSSRDSSRDEPRGRELMIASDEAKHVRLVSPPKDKSDEKPLKGILKQPKSSFPEEA